MQAGYTHPTPLSGFTDFEIATANTFGGTVVQSGSSVLLATGDTGSFTVDTLDLGTTYYWRVRAVDELGFVSGWSGIRSFSTPAAPSLTLTLDTHSLDLGTVVPGDEEFGSFTTTVTTTNATGYQLTATGTATGTDGDECACTVPTDDWTDSGATPGPWSALVSGTHGYAGITVRDALDGRLGKWGIGTGTGETDTFNNYYAALNTSAIELHNRTTAAPAGDPVVATWRFTPSTTTSAGDHPEDITVTALANP